MEVLLTTLTAWYGTVSAWLQSTTGLTIKDLALFVGGALIAIAALWLGLYTGKPRYREAARFGWCLLLLGAAVVAWGIYNHNMRD